MRTLVLCRRDKPMLPYPIIVPLHQDMVTQCSFLVSHETTRAFIIKKIRKRTTCLPTQDVPPILAAPTLQLSRNQEQAAAASHHKPPGLVERRQFRSPPRLNDGLLAHPFRPKTRLLSEPWRRVRGSDPWHSRRTVTATERSLTLPCSRRLPLRCRRCQPPCRRHRPRRRCQSRGPRRTRSRSRRPRRRRSCPSR